jgi:hypothetical protein
MKYILSKMKFPAHLTRNFSKKRTSTHFFTDFLHDKSVSLLHEKGTALLNEKDATFLSDRSLALLSHFYALFTQQKCATKAVNFTTNERKTSVCTQAQHYILI